MKALDPQTTSLKQAQDWLRDRVYDGANCPCCTQRAQVYPRDLHSGIAYALLAFVRVTLTISPKDGWLSVSEDFAHVPEVQAKLLRNREYNKLAYWGLLQGFGKNIEPDAKTSHTSRWRVTDLGFKFARGEVTVPDRVFVYAKNSKIKPPPEAVIKQISIVEALTKKFNYTELMKGLK